jgi:hypothetical protein
MAKPQYAGPWQRLRRVVLERDGHVCRIQGPNCTTVATQVDHITPVELGGAWFDLDNLRAACRRCNVGAGNQQRLEAWRTGPHITLVYGPPGAGKSTWVQQHAQPGDLIVDYDLIGTALGSPDRATHQRMHAAINAARNAVLNQIRKAEHGATAVWIVSTNPNACAMFPHHEAIYLHPGRDVAYQRAADGGRTDGALALIDGWTEGRSPAWDA